MDIRNELNHWLEKATDPEIAAQLKTLAEEGSESEIADAFFQELEFGTAGLRGIIGAGTNRMNIYTVGKATQGLADYLNAHYEEPSVAIARDSRLKGELFVQRAASVLAANGIRVHIFPRVEPTPALSFAVRDLKCSAGINMTASHNPAAYNGYKVYGEDGCQIASEAAAEISRAVAAVDPFEDVLSTPFQEAIDFEMVDWISDDTLDRYIQAVYTSNASFPGLESAPVKVVYTPLNGTGLECVGRILEKVGITDVTVVPQQAQPDGNFPTCPKPNPEIREALELGIQLCEEVQPDLLLATDPDADRVGVACKNGDDYVLINGNEMGILLLDYIAKVRTQSGTMPVDPIAISTIVSTAMIDSIAADYGISIKRTLTGFKWIGSIITSLEEHGEEDRFVFGFEESYGYLAGSHVRDKDAVVASMLICQMAQYYKSKGLNLAQAMDNLYQHYGYFFNRTINLEFPGADGAAKMAELMANLRRNPIYELAGMPVQEMIDYSNGIGSLPAANVVEFRLPDSNKIIFRPSGTEPKIKAYLFAKGESAAQAEELLQTLEQGAISLIG